MAPAEAAADSLTQRCYERCMPWWTAKEALSDYWFEWGQAIRDGLIFFALFALVMSLMFEPWKWPAAIKQFWTNRRARKK